MDLQLRCTDRFLEEIGVQKGIMTLVDEDRQRQVLELLAGHKVHLCSGGSACNTIVGIADFGGRCAYACKVGNDTYGARYVEEMRSLGVTVEVPPNAGSTGTCIVLITPDAQRTMLTHLGCSSQLDRQDIDGEEIAKSDYLYVEGYLFTGESTRRAALHAIELAGNAGVRVALTVSDPFLIEHHREDFWDLIKGPVDLLFCNLEEARALTGKHDAIECARILHAHCRNVCLTLGRNGSIIMHENEVLPIEGVEVKAVDTTGAGDMYAAGVLYGITHGMDWKTAGHLGSHAAARIVSQLGARLGRRFTPEEIQQLLS